MVLILSDIELSSYDTNASINNLMRQRLHSLLYLIGTEPTQEFGTRLVRNTILLIKQLFRLLTICVGRGNAETYLPRITALVLPLDSK